VSRSAWVCEACHEPVPNSLDRFVISEDAMRADGKLRAYRVTLHHLCGGCMRAREGRLRPTSSDPNQSAMLL
jgi:hypothetical protein